MADVVTGIVSAAGKESLTVNTEVFTGDSYKTIKNAVEAADIIAVDTGSYKEGRVELSGQTVCVAENVVVYGNTLSDATLSGGAFAFNSGDNILSGMTFSGNTFDAATTSKYGGGAVVSVTSLVINGTRFFKNSSSNYGGAVYLRSGDLTVNNGFFSENNGRAGGAIFSTGGNMTINGGTFYKNFADSGAAVIITETEIQRTVVINSG